MTVHRGSSILDCTLGEQMVVMAKMKQQQEPQGYSGDSVKMRLGM